MDLNSTVYDRDDQIYDGLVNDNNMQIAEFRLQTRPYTWKVFKDVVLDSPNARVPFISMPTPFPPYSYAFRNGLKVEVGCLTETAANGGRWWQPDGKLLPGRVKTFWNSIAWNSHSDSDRQRALCIRYAVPKETVLNTASELTLNGVVKDGISRIPYHVIDSGPNVINIPYPNATGELTYRYGVATGAWRTVAKLPIPSNMDRKRTVGVGPNYITLILPDKLTLGYSLGSGHGNTVTVNLTGSSIGSNACRVVAVYSNGHTQELRGDGSTGPGIGFSFYKATGDTRYVPIDLNGVREFQLQTCPYEWAEFKHIKLNPSN